MGGFEMNRWANWLRQGVIWMAAIAIWLTPASASASLTDDSYDGNIFALYAGNGSIVPPRISLAQSLKQGKPTLLFFYVDDSSDCKQYASIISGLQAPYGRVVNFVPVMADSIQAFPPSEPGYYFKGAVPQTLLLDGVGNVVIDQTGSITYETVDDSLRELFGLLPRDESVTLQPRQVNELNTELVPVE